MASILADAEVTLQNGTSMVIGEKIFSKILFNFIEKRKHTTKINFLRLYINRPEIVLNGYLVTEKNALMHCTIKDLYEVFLLEPDEIRDLCKGYYVKSVQDNSYNYYSRDFKNNEYEIHGKYNVNLDNALYVINDADVAIYWNGEIKLLSEIDEVYRRPIKNSISKAHVEFSYEFYESLKIYCYNNFEKFLNMFTY